MTDSTDLYSSPVGFVEFCQMAAVVLVGEVRTPQTHRAVGPNRRSHITYTIIDSTDAQTVVLVGISEVM